ncbi:MAG TPA: hydroxyacylglutathione hydrolase [Methylomirabilota bacterium]|nr:hydroxyacylglutathione hydrolase [Methylomirabilota bacterium]
MPIPEIVMLPCLSDNYAVLMHDAESGTTVLVDAPEAVPVQAALARRKWTLTHILVTHHHTDHVAGIEALKAATGAKVIGPAAEADKIPGLDETVSEGDRVVVGPFSASVIATPGHTLGHIAYFFEDIEVLFAGDTLFSLGCGRIFEGTPAQMWESLQKLAALPDDTIVFCGHEYTQSNARFAATVDADNEMLKERIAQVEESRAGKQPTVPTTIGVEKETNPFLRAGDPVIAAAVGLAGAPAVEVFAEVRRRKDNA